MKVSDQRKLGSLLSYVQIFVGAITSFIFTPVILNLLGQSEYGLYNTVSSTIAMLSLLSLGFNSGYVRYYSKYAKNNDTEAIWKLNGLFLVIFIILGLIALVCGVILSFNLEYVFSDGLTGKEYQIAKILMILLACNLSISFPMSVFTNIISANERFVFLKSIGILRTFLIPVITVCLLLFGFKSIGMVVGTLIITLVIDGIYVYYVFKVLNNRFFFRGFENGQFFSLFSYTTFIAINLIVDQINWNVDKILLGRYKGTEEVAIYSIGYTIYHQYMMFSTSISSVFTPQIHRIVSETSGDVKIQRKMLTDIFVKVGRIQFLVMGLIASGLVFFGEAFISFWAGEGYEDAYYVVLLLSISASIALIQNVGIEIQRALNLHKFRSYAYLVMAILNLCLSIILCQKYGAVGAAIGTAVSLLLANGLLINIYYHKRCNIDVLEFWRNIAHQSLGLVPPIILGMILYQLDYKSVSLLVCAIIVYTMVYCVSVYGISMNKYERHLVKSVFQKILATKGMYRG